MAAPRYIHLTSSGRTASYASPDVVPDAWRAGRSGGRSGELSAGQPAGGALGFPGPDQGYALKLAGLFEGRVFLTPSDLLAGVSEQDVHAGCVAVALKRASLFGRAPVVYDLQVAYGCWGWLGDAPEAELVALRGGYFCGVADSHHYAQARRLVEAVSAEALLLSPKEVERLAEQNWRALIGATGSGVGNGAGAG